MGQKALAVAIVLICLAHLGCSNESVPSKGRTMKRPGLCRVIQENVATFGAPPVLGTPTGDESPLQSCRTKLGYPCSCEDYAGMYPAPPVVPTNISLPPGSSAGVEEGLTTGVYDSTITRRCHNRGQPALCVDDNFLEGCTNSLVDGETIFAWPDCATIGQASGIVYEPGGYASDSLFDPGNDDDFSFHMCPEAMSVRMANDTWVPKELREPASFYARGESQVVGDQPSGRLHIETQGCRFYNGEYRIRDADGAERNYQSRPQPGDMVTAAGDWAWDRYHELMDGTGWMEIHEARITASARRAPAPADGSVSYLFVSSTFINDSAQSDLLEIHAKVPAPSVAPPGQKWELATCEIDRPTVAGMPVPSFSVVKRPAGVCSTYPLDHVLVEPIRELGACRIKVDSINFDVGEAGRTKSGYSCEDECGGIDFHEDDFEISGEGQPTVIPNTCNRLAYAGVIRATWRLTPPPPTMNFAFPADGSAPGDLWMCNCSCDDPASALTSLTAPVGGCAVTGFDPTNLNDQQAACAQACGGFICSARQPCRTGGCKALPPASGSVGRLVGRNACVPGQDDLYRVTDAATYRVRLAPLNPGTGLGSRATFTIGSQTATNVPLNGLLALNLSSSYDTKSRATIPVLDVANIELSPNNFTLGRAVTNAKVFTSQRLWAKFTTANNFTFEPLSVVLGLRGLVDGVEAGLNQENVVPAFGTIDLTSRTFTLDITAQDVDQGETRTMVAHLVGTIENGPPSAVITGPQTVECAATATLSGASSSDVDGGDAVTRYQWFVEGTPGGNASSIPIASKKLGSTRYELIVSDRSLSAATASTTVNVVDTTGPRFTVGPNAVSVTDCTIKPNLGQVQAVDDCGGSVTLSNNAPATFALGNTIVTWTARDARGNVRTATQMVTVPLGDNPVCCPAGTNVVVLTSNNDTYTGTSGNDCILGRGGQDTISGGAGNDVISGGDGNDIINGGTGNDRLFGGPGQDQLNGGDNDDQLAGGDGDDRVNGDAGNDLMSGGPGQDLMTGGSGNDNMSGGDGDDRLEGGPGNDTMDGGGLHDTCVSGGGVDVFVNCQTQQ
jgi:Ca2+-binding RTX toxin-like protein